MLKAMFQGGVALRFAATTLMSDRELMPEAVRQNGVALQLAAAEFKNDREFMLGAVRQSGVALRFVATNSGPTATSCRGPCGSWLCSMPPPSS